MSRQRTEGETDMETEPAWGLKRRQKESKEIRHEEQVIKQTSGKHVDMSISKPTAHAADPVLFSAIREFRLQCSSVAVGTVPGYERNRIDVPKGDHSRPPAFLSSAIWG